MAAGPTVDPVLSQQTSSWSDDLARLAEADLQLAVRRAAEARRAGLSHPVVHQLLGLQLKQAGRLDEAVVEFGEGLKLDPQNLKLMTEVGFCLIELNRRPEAAQVFGVALKLDPTSVDAFYGYGWVAEGLGALDQAQSAWERVVALKPDHADALAGLSGLAVRRRDWALTRDMAERAAAKDPFQTDALMNLARADIGELKNGDAERRLEGIIALPHLKPLARAAARIMLGDALDGQGRYAEALAAYREGKAETRALHADEFQRPDVPSVVDGVGRILREFQTIERDAWSRAPGPGVPTPHRGHAFLMGFPRSGTTLLEQILATHPDIVTLEERPALIKAELEFLTREGGVRRLAHVVDDFLTPYREDYWRRSREFGIEPRGKIVVDKQPLNTFRLPLLGKVFPDAKIIFALRDPRDVVLSCFRRNFNVNAAMYQFTTLEGAARFYATVMEAGEVYRRELPLKVFELRYEDLVADFTERTKALCAFLEVDYTPRLADFAETAARRRIATPSSTQVGRGLYEEGVGQWRRYAEALAPVTPILAPWIEKFGYGDPRS